GAGQKRRFGDEQAMSALPPKADIGVERPVCFWPKATTTEVGSGHVPILFCVSRRRRRRRGRRYCAAMTSCSSPCSVAGQSPKIFEERALISPRCASTASGSLFIVLIAESGTTPGLSFTCAWKER